MDSSQFHSLGAMFVGRLRNAPPPPSPSPSPFCLPQPGFCGRRRSPRVHANRAEAVSVLKIKDTVVQQPGELVQISVVFEFEYTNGFGRSEIRENFFRTSSVDLSFFSKKNVSLRVAYNVRYNSRLHVKANIF